MSLRRWLPVALSLALVAGATVAQPKAPLEGAAIYTCVDAKGRRITADRPIVECLDREQQQYGKGGTVRGTLPPSMTAEERAAADEKARRDQEQATRQADLRRRDRLLVGRYPNEASHQRERDEALTRIDDIIATGERRVLDLQKQRAELQAQIDRSGNDAVKSARLKRSLAENEDNQAAQRRILAAQADERQRVTGRFDEELARLKVLWAQQATAPARPAAVSTRPAASRPKS